MVAVSNMAGGAAIGLRLPWMILTTGEYGIDPMSQNGAVMVMVAYKSF